MYRPRAPRRGTGVITSVEGGTSARWGREEESFSNPPQATPKANRRAAACRHGESLLHRHPYRMLAMRNCRLLPFPAESCRWKNPLVDHDPARCSSSQNPGRRGCQPEAASYFRHYLQSTDQASRNGSRSAAASVVPFKTSRGANTSAARASTAASPPPSTGPNSSSHPTFAASDQHFQRVSVLDLTRPAVSSANLPTQFICLQVATQVLFLTNQVTKSRPPSKHGECT